MLRMRYRRAAARHPPAMIVVCLCAAWCDTCTEFRVAFDRIARQRPEMHFVWLDIEDDSALCGDIDVENFPTLAIYRDDTLLHFGVSLPQEGTVARLIDAMAARADAAAAANVAEAVLELPRRLAQRN
jgi:thioredoxin reductase (NADPH)